MLHCCICGDPITDTRFAHYETIGWRKEVGSSQVVELPLRTGSVMCDACMAKKKLEAKSGPLGGTLF